MKMIDENKIQIKCCYFIKYYYKTKGNYYEHAYNHSYCCHCLSSNQRYWLVICQIIREGDGNQI